MNKPTVSESRLMATLSPTDKSIDFQSTMVNVEGDGPTNLDARWLRAAFFAFEERESPFRHRVQNFSIWPKLRFLTFDMMRNQLGMYTPRPQGPKTNVFRKRFRSATLLPEGALEILKIGKLGGLSGKLSILALTRDIRLQDAVDGIYRNRCFDFFSPPLPNLITVYDISTRRAALRAYPRPVITNAHQYVWRAIELCLRPKPTAALSVLFHDFSNFMSAAGWSTLPADLYAKWCSAERAFRADVASTRYILASLNPSLLLLDTGYGREGAIAAAKCAGVPVWELQHGFLGPEHMGYIYDRESVPSNRSALPFPDRFFTFGDYFREVIEQSGYCAPDSVSSLGLPRLEHFKKTIPRASWKRRPFRVLISSQWIYYESLVDFLRRATSHSASDIEFVIKPHPDDSLEMIDGYRKIGKSLKVLSRSDSIYESFRDVHLHAAVSSTTLFESIGMSIPTVVLALPGWSNAKVLVETDAAHLSDDPLEFAAFISELAGDQERYEALVEKTADSARYYWAADPGQRFDDLIRGAVE